MTMLYFGTKITSANDLLQPLTLAQLYRSLVQPKQSFADHILQLRMMATMDVQMYRQMKTQLPYLVVGQFHPAIRRKENFMAIEYFFLDLDHLSQKGLDIEEVRYRLSHIPEVLLMFTSPGGDGLKILFRLNAPCKDAGLYTSFFKLFARAFAQKHDLQEVVDFQICDVSRACFMSIDEHAYYHADALPVDIESYIPMMNYEEVAKEIKVVEKEHKAVASAKYESPDDATFQKIKALLQNKPLLPKKEVFVPKQIDDAMEKIGQSLLEYEMVVSETTSIQYGRRIKIESGQFWAEVNLFYGKRGFSVVKTLKNGSNATLADMATQALNQIVTELYQ